jgi:hypothetical protein
VRLEGVEGGRTIAAAVDGRGRGAGDPGRGEEQGKESCEGSCAALNPPLSCSPKTLNLSPFPASNE